MIGSLMWLKAWLLEIRAPFLLLPVTLSFVGSSLAIYEGHFDSFRFLLFTAVLVLFHVSVNTLNEYYDYKTGIDQNTTRTMFSGGSGMLQAGLLKPEKVLQVALICFVAGAALSAYVLYVVGVILLPIIILGMIFVAFYTQLFARIMLGEIVAGLGLGFLPVLGAYMIQTSSVSLESIFLSILAGILTFNLLFLNEFPDLDADAKGGRKNLVMALGTRESASLYSGLTLSVYGVICLGILAGIFPLFTAIGLLTVPLAFKASRMSRRNPKILDGFVPALKANVQIILITQALLAVGYLLAAAV
jgi:1,4-dihydroxy-2-naphthoate octaprenyltransferase